MSASSFALGILLLLVLFSGTAVAQTTPENKAAAESLFRDGKKFMADENYEQACQAFEKSQELDPAVGTLMNLGDCYEHRGKTASAWVTFSAAVSAAKRKGQAERERVARKRANALEPKLARLTIEVSPDGGVEEITRDGMVVPPAVWGTPLPVDPGEHALEASGPGRMPWSGRVSVAAAGIETVTIPVLEMKSDKPGAPSSSAAAAPDDEGSAADEDPGRTQKIVAITLGGAGVLAMGVGSVLALSAKSSYDDAPGCTGNTCGQMGYDQRNSAISQANLATVLFGLGAAAAAGGAALWFLAPSSSETAPVQVGFGNDLVFLAGSRQW